MRSPCTWPEQLTRYVTERLQCDAQLLTRPGLHLVVAAQPRWRVWLYLVPLWVMAFDRAAVVSVAPELADHIAPLAQRATADSVLQDPALAQMRAAAAHWGPVEWLRRAYWLYCTSETFAPRYAAPVFPAPPDHPEARSLRRLHRGEVFAVIRNGELVSRSSIKTESDAAWEIAVTTHEPHRRLGYGASVVSRATEFILAQGKVALYHCEVDNVASLRLAQSLGYQVFAREAMWSLEAGAGRCFWQGRVG